MAGIADSFIADRGNSDLPEAVKALNSVTAEEARRKVPLDEAGMFEEARGQTGLPDFGSDRFRAGLGVLVRALEAEADLTLLGRIVRVTNWVRSKYGRQAADGWMR